MAEDVSRAKELKELAILFLGLGATAFGGPAAHIAMMEDEVVHRRGWLTREKFLDLLGATNLIPGPNSTEMAIHIGQQRAGWPGFLIAGACFIFPAALITLVFAWAYVRFGSLPQAVGFLYGVKPAVLAVVVLALWKLGKSAIKSWFLVAICALAVAATVLGVNELAVLFGAGALYAAARRVGDGQILAASVPAWLTYLSPQVVDISIATSFSLERLFYFFLKTGAVLFGSGYVLLAFLHTDLVENWHWLTEQQLLDAVAVGQVTPGPIFSAATFVGYLLGGASGATLATLGIFLPAFVFVAISGPVIPLLRRSPSASAFLDGVIVASLALMAVVTFQLGRTAILDIPSTIIAIASVFFLIRYKMNSAWLVLSAGFIGFIANWILG